MVTTGQQKTGSGEYGYDSGVHKGKIRLNKRKILHRRPIPAHKFATLPSEGGVPSYGEAG